MQKEEIKFSIIIPLYNKARYVSNTINSVLSQSYENFEVIIVNDGSTDNSLEVVSNFKDERIKVFTKQNGGVSSARNYGIQKASYPYIAFLDADDLWEKSFLSEIKLMIEKYPEASVFCTNYASYYPTGKILINNVKGTIPEGVWDDYFKVAIKGNNIIWTSACCIRKKVFLDVGCFNESYSMGEDLEMWFRLGLKYQFAYSDNVLAIYNRYDQSSLTNSYHSDPLKNWRFHIQLNQYNPDIDAYRYLELLLADKIVTYIFKRRFDLGRLVCTQNHLKHLKCVRLFYKGLKLKLKRKLYKMTKKVSIKGKGKTIPASFLQISRND